MVSSVVSSMLMSDVVRDDGAAGRSIVRYDHNKAIQNIISDHFLPFLVGLGRHSTSNL